jgi:hypothetical protein
MIHPKNFKSTGDLRKDYMAYSEMLERSSRMEIINGIHHFIERKTPPPDAIAPSPRDSIEGRNLSSEDISNLSEEDVKQIQTEIIVHGLEYRLNYKDAIALAFAIQSCTFKFIKMRFVLK